MSEPTTTGATTAGAGSTGPTGAGPTGTETTGSKLGLVLGLLALATLLLLVAGGRTWASGLTRLHVGGVFLSQQRAAKGHSLSGVPTAAGVLALAGIAAVFATRGRGRVALGVVLLVAGVAAMATSIIHGVRPPSGLTSNGWPAIAGLGGLTLAVAASAMIRFGRDWPALGRRYDAPDSAPAAPAGGIWEALERGEDPTAADPSAPEAGTSS